MFTLEDKINIVLTYIATDDKISREKAKALAAEAINGISIPSDPSESNPYTSKRPYDMDGLIMDHLKQCGMPPPSARFHLYGYRNQALPVQF